MLLRIQDRIASCPFFLHPYHNSTDIRPALQNLLPSSTCSFPILINVTYADDDRLTLVTVPVCALQDLNLKPYMLYRLLN